MLVVLKLHKYYLLDFSSIRKMCQSEEEWLISLCFNKDRALWRIELGCKYFSRFMFLFFAYLFFKIASNILYESLSDWDDYKALVIPS